HPKFNGIEADEAEINIRAYAKYLLRQGSISEKRELLGNLRSRLMYLHKKVTLMQEDSINPSR
ncbi:TPA: hypothetical protein DCW61_01385, partial [Candidatus Uhrbacteria bacterium]|nr:hypothetical protein [Candidatus Uhrbacteria bacterium]